jgi:hypothetical protein
LQASTVISTPNRSAPTIGGVGPLPGEAGQFVRLPGLVFAIEHPQARYRARLLERFPLEQASIEAVPCPQVRLLALEQWLLLL